mmetsp:Transcript_8353/g.10737  ORF Transcript_8353/g.10737 Transcript_8353/m.10737 type:complete len:578 (-) Transcript_8353:204-1937(-)
MDSLAFPDSCSLGDGGDSVQKKKVLNIEEIFQQVSNFTGASLTSKSGKNRRLCLTPISEEACMIHGIDPNVLQIRDFDSFWENGMDPEIQRLRHEAYSRRRHELMNVARDERFKLHNQELNSIQDSSNSKIALSHEEIWEQEAIRNSALVEIEERRLAKLKQRKEKEILGKIQYEAKMLEIRKQMKEKVERDALLEEKRHREKERKNRQAAEERRLKELRRKAQQDAEEERARKLAQDMFERELAITEEKNRLKREREVQARLADEVRQRKKNEQKLITKKKLAEKSREAERRAKERDIREAQRQELVDRQRQKERLISEAKRKLTADRLQKNKEAARKREEEKKKMILQKKKLAEQNRLKALRDQDMKKDEKKKERMLIEKKRILVLKQMQESKEEEKEILLHKFQANDVHLSKLQTHKARELQIAKEKRKLVSQLKQDNVMRIKRAQEYQAKKILEKIKNDDQRSKTMMRRKNEIANHRIKAAIEAKRQKDLLSGLLEKTNDVNSIQKVKDILFGNTNKLKVNQAKNKGQVGSTSHVRAPDDSSNRPKAPSLEERLSREAGYREEKPKLYKSPYA